MLDFATAKVKPTKSKSTEDGHGVKDVSRPWFVVTAEYILAAQENRSEISLQGTGFFTKDATGNGNVQRGTETGGVLVGYRYHLNRWLAAEAAYGYDRNTQQFFVPVGVSRIQANVHQATGGLVFSMPTPHSLRISPYLLAEGGALLFDPTNNSFGSVAGAQRQATGVFVYGGGADFPVVRHLSLRAEYRGLVYSAPDFGLHNLNTNAVTHVAQPSAGIVVRF
ncbi:MAG TPA: outer membrane beta-barrel protein [Terriglobales bacterium]|nr:outer membrane beta-barrel protein [Terriglobales bacterium]